MSDLQFSEEEQAYLDAEMGTSKPVEEVKPETEETPEPEQETTQAEPDASEEQKTEEDQPEEVKADSETKAEEQPEKKEAPKRKTASQRIVELKEERKRLREENALLKKAGAERLAAIEEKLAAPQTQEPDPEYDPEGALKFKEAELERYKALEKERQEEASRQAKANEEVQELQSMIIDHEDQFVEEHEDYFDAIEWGKEKQIDQYQKEYGMTLQEAKDATAQDIREIAVKIRDMGRGNVAAYLYNYIQGMGWKNAAPNGNGQPNANQGKGDMEAVARGQKAAVNSKGGTGSNKGLQLEDIVGMPDDEFHKRVSDMDALKKLFGG